MRFLREGPNPIWENLDTDTDIHKWKTVWRETEKTM